ncbi:MAG TPA: penicillin-binding protein activator [Candidatus Paceibacterota bacterium]
MSKNKLWIIVGILAVLIIALVCLSGSRSGDGLSKPIKIGVMAILSGDAAAWGNNAKKAIDMAIEEHNAKYPEKQVETVYVDTKGDSKEAVTGFTKLTKVDKVQFIIGPLFLNELTSIDPLVQASGIPVISPAYTPKENRKNPKNPLLMWMDAMIETERIARYVIGQGVKTVSIIHSTDAWETSVAGEFKKQVEAAGVKVLAVETVQQDANDVRLSVTKLIAGKPEAVFLSTYFQYINSLKALGEQRYSGKMFSIEIDDYLAGETKDFVREVLAINPENYSSDFSAAFEKRYGVRPGMPAGHAFDAANLLLENIAKDSSKESVFNDFKTRSSYKGVSGEITFTPDGKTLFPTALYRISDGKIERVGPLE